MPRRIRGIRDRISGGLILGRVAGRGFGPPQLLHLDSNNRITQTSGVPGGGGSTPPANIQTLLDTISTTRGSILYRGAAAWVALTPGTSGFFLKTLGAGADPAWASAAANIQTLLDTIGSTQGMILYRGASSWAALSPGTAGYALVTGGAAANPSWASVAANIQTLLDTIGTTQGQIIYYNGTDWVALNPGVSGQILRTGGSGANPYWSDLTAYTNPGGTGDRTASITVTSNLVCNTGTDSNFVDGDFSANSTGSRDFQSGATGGIIKWDFGASTYKIIDEIKWYSSSATAHSTWVVEGSQDGDHWVGLAAPFTLGGATGANLITFANTTGYRYYQLRCTHDNTGVSSSPWDEELEFRIADGIVSVPPNTVKSYGAKGGSGPRTSLITVTTTATLGGGTIDKLVEGSAFYGGTDDASHAMFFTAGQSGKEIKFDFGASYSPVITEFTWFQDGVNNHGTWDFEGSANGSSWTSLATGLTLGGATRTTYTGMSGNTTAYRYYRLNQTAGTTSSAPWNREIWFKLSA